MNAYRVYNGTRFLGIRYAYSSHEAVCQPGHPATHAVEDAAA